VLIELGVTRAAKSAEEVVRVEETARPHEESMYRFSRFEIDHLGRTLRHDGRRVALASQARALLSHLIRHRSRAVGPEELLQVGWGETAVGEGSLRAAIHQIRTTLGDDGSGQRFVETVRGRGYRFVAAVEETCPSGDRESGAAPALIGRDDALVELRNALAESNSRGCVRVLVGPPGVGKSRLARELLPAARTQGFCIVESHGAPEATGFPFDPWMQLLAALLQRADAATLQRCHTLAPSVLGAFAERNAAARFSTSSQEAPEQRRNDFFEELAHLFIDLSEPLPLLLLLEDLQWADEASLAFFRHFSRVLARSRIFLLVTCRQLAARENRSLARALEAVQRVSHNRRIELSNLSVSAVGALLRGAGPRVQPELAEQIHALTAGNPLFSLELAKLIRDGDTADALSLLREPGIEVQTIIRRRLDALSERCRATLMRASVVGYEFSIAELAAVCGQTPKTALAYIDECLECSMLVEQASGRMSFPHPLVRDAAYEALTKSECSELHRVFAEWLEKQGEGPSTSTLVKLAHHYYRGAPSGGSEKAIHYARQCAERAVRSTAWASAVTYYDHALQCADLTERFAPLTRIELAIERAKAQRAGGAAHAAVNRTLLELAERASVQGSSELFARAVLAYTGHSEAAYSPTRFQGVFDRAEIELLERALGADDISAESRILLLCSLAFALAYSKERARREDACKSAIELARALPQPWLLARALTVQIYSCAAPDNLARRLSACDELVDLVHRHGLKEQEVEARMTRAVCQLELGELAAAERDEQRARLLAEGLRSSRLQVRAELLQFQRASMRGDLDETERLAQRCIDEAPNDLIARTLFVIRTASIKLLRTAYNENAIALMQTFIAAYPDVVGFRCGLASAYAVFGDADAAREQFDVVAANDFEALPVNINWLSEMAFLAEAAVFLDDPLRGALVYAKLLPFAELWMFYASEAISAGPVAHWLAELAITKRDAVGAAHWLDRARTLCNRLGATLFLQYNAQAEARLLRLCGSERDEPRIEALLDSTVRFADAHGARWLRIAAQDFNRRWQRPRRAALGEPQVRASHLAAVRDARSKS
jgi:DNA-binding winged helix-turn-helix (wHTH) protein